MKICRFSNISAAACLMLLFASSAQTAEFPYPKVGYSADVKMNMGKGPDGKPMILTGKVYSSNKKERREMVGFGEKTIMIRRRDKGVSWHLIPKRKMYMENLGGRGDQDPESMIREGNLKLTKLGSERVNGMPTTKYRIETVHKDGSRFVGHHWITKENIPVRMEGTSKGQHFRFDYTNIKIGKQDHRLFEVPAGYQRLAIPEMPGWSPMGRSSSGKMPQGSFSGGMTKEQAEQMRKQMEEMMKRRQR